jgi:hypothetical protein
MYHNTIYVLAFEKPALPKIPSTAGRPDFSNFFLDKCA